MKKTMKVLAILLSIALIASLTGCSGKSKKAKEKETNAEIEELQMQVENLTEEVANKEAELALYDEKYQSTGTFKKRNIIKSGDNGFNKVNDKIVLKDEFIIPTGNKSNQSGVMLSKTITITPNKTWQVSVSTAETDFSNEKAYGTIKVYEYDVETNSDTLAADYINPILKINGLDPKKKRDIFVGDTKRGEEITARILIYDSTTVGNTYRLSLEDLGFTDEEAEENGLALDSQVELVARDMDKKIDAQLRVGLVHTPNGMIEYEFIAENETANTLIDNLLTSIKVGQNGLFLQ